MRRPYGDFEKRSNWHPAAGAHGVLATNFTASLISAASMMEKPARGTLDVVKLPLVVVGEPPQEVTDRKFNCALQVARVSAIYHGMTLYGGRMPTRTLATLQRKGTESMNVGFHGIWGLLILAGDIWAILNIAQSSASNEKKLIWIIAVILLPLLGLVLWYFLGPRSGKA